MNSNNTRNTGTVVEVDGLTYQTGFGNTFESECIPGALPIGRNNPRRVPYGLYAEQLSGTAFTAPRVENQRIWLYRIQPSVVVGDTQEEETYFGGETPANCTQQVSPIRWNPLEGDATTTMTKDFIDGMRLMCTAGAPSSKSGLSVYMYAFGSNMKERYFSNSDGDILIVPQQGTLEVITEVGKFNVPPGEICVIPRGFVMQINTVSSTESNAISRGYLLEIYHGHFQLPDLGPIGSNGLANARDFYYPVAACSAFSNQDEYNKPCTIVTKMHTKLYSKSSDHSPMNVVAWHGNYLPFKYNLSRFCAVNSVSYDHLDPSIYTVLTCQSETKGTALADFVIFPPRIMATDENTFRPPWFHRNTMSEFMGLIYGEYDAKEGKGFRPGGASLHNCMVPHGPDAVSYAKAIADPCDAPKKLDSGLAFMFETCLPFQVAPAAQKDTTWRDMSYTQCWQGLKATFTGWKELEAAMNST